MGREIRHVPMDWEHPKREGGHYQPMHDITQAQAIREWSEDECDYTPDPEYHRPEWPENAVMGVALYENVSEGTPITPTFRSIEGLVAHLTTKGDSGGNVWSMAACASITKHGFAMSGVMQGGKYYRPHEQEL